MKTPEEVRQNLRRREWDNRANLRDRLMGARENPIIERLGAPTGPEALADMSSYELFVRRWRAEAERFPDAVRFEKRNMQTLKNQDVPIEVVLQDLRSLALFLSEPPERIDELVRRLDQLGKHGASVREAAARQISAIEALSGDDASVLERAVGGLSAGIGRGLHLRSLRLPGVHTKFVENNLTLLERLVDAKFNGEVSQVGGLLPWLGCFERDADSLLVRPLCDSTRKSFAGATHFWTESAVLRDMQMPGRAVVIFENAMYRFPLPEVDGVIAICGAGNNLQWLDAPWLHDRPVAYSGDLDTWGVHLFAKVRALVPHVVPLLMNCDTLRANDDQLVIEPTPCNIDASELPDEQRELLVALSEHRNAPARLEHDKLKPAAYSETLHAWRKSLKVPVSS